jgi:hypothetical protein
LRLYLQTATEQNAASQLVFKPQQKPMPIVLLIQTIHPISMKSTTVRASIVALLAIPSFLMLSNPALAEKRDFAFHNRTGVTIKNLYISSPSERDWGDDRLGTTVLEPNEQVVMDNYTSGSDCIQDFKVRFSDDSESEIRGINMCTVDEYYLL